ncbi:hypothetical protein TRFO_26319 [Tritrichomonas foetus]|uniref:Uncharacterized protein n=1 Tax=Tritrichomonas foetus TaxID=1144522 RepID=A0A1J4K2Z9_9EUKA|nr:hypothetical protein TRFO_26319 [Tritrichomonas foetus]|eukprot:OHT05817.1 hypothetical protein TRFO_26319 [Tritrichomonas foetus]
MFYKSLTFKIPDSKMELLTPGYQDDIYDIMRLNKFSHKEKNIFPENDLYKDFQTTILRIFSEDNKEQFLEELRDKIHSAEVDLFPVFSSGHVLNFLIDLINTRNYPYVRLSLDIIIELLFNSSQFASFVTSNCITFKDLLHENLCVQKIFTIFTLTLYDIPDFCEYYHSIKLIELMMIICNDEKKKTDKEIISSISTLLSVMIKLNRLLSNSYSDESQKYEFFYHLTSISHFLLNKTENIFRKPKNELTNECFRKKKTKKSPKNKNEPNKNLIISYQQTAIEIFDTLSLTHVAPMKDLFDEISCMNIYNLISKGDLLYETSHMIFTLLHHNTESAIEFITNNDILVPLSRQFIYGKNEFQLTLLPLFIDMLYLSDELGEMINYDILGIFDANLHNYTAVQKEKVYRLFCVLAKRFPDRVINIDNLSTYLEDCFDFADIASNDFIVLMLDAFLSIMRNHILLTDIFDQTELVERLEGYVLNSHDEKIIELSQTILVELH